MLPLLALATLSTAQMTADDARRPRVQLCTAQQGGLNRERAIEQIDGRIRWYPATATRGTTFDPSLEITAQQRDWYRSHQPLTVGGLTYHYDGEGVLDDMPFRRYNRVISPIDGVPALVPMGAENQQVWVLLDPVGCRFAVWSRAPAAS